MASPEQQREIKQMEAEAEQSVINWQLIAGSAALLELRAYLIENQDSLQRSAVAQTDNLASAVIHLQKANVYATILAYIDDKLS